MKTRLPIALVGMLLLCGCSTLAMNRYLVENHNSLMGTYNMVRVGGTFDSDADRLIILDMMGDSYSFEPVAGPGRVEKFPGIEAGEALRRAETFFAEHCAYDGFQLRRLTLPNNRIVGYELLPNYPTILCEEGNEILVSYGKPDNGEIPVYTTLLLKIESSGSSMIDKVDNKTKVD